MSGNLLAGEQTRDAYIDVLKGISILFVILVHFNQNWTAPYGILSEVSSIGARAPQFFFVMSAFLTWKSIDSHGLGKIFFISRLKRLIPTYYVALVFAMLLPTITIGDFSPWNIAAHFLLIHGFNPHWINTVLGVGWYIGDLVIFYLICPLLRQLIHGLKSSLVLFFISVTLSAISLVLYNTFGFGNGLDQFFNTFFFIHQLPVLVLGILLYYLVEKIKDGDINARRTIIIYGGIILGFVVIAILFHLNKRIFTSSLIAGLLFSWLFLFSYSIRGLLSLKIFRPLAVLGKHSYGIYLFHYTVICCIVLIPHQEKNILLWLGFYIAVLLISFVITLAMEKIEKYFRHIS